MIPRSRIPVAVLGATGAVGQRLVARLAAHPWFELAEVVASDRSAGKPYAEAADWRLPGELPPDAAGLVVKALGEPLRSRVVLSALGSDVAGPAEDALADAGCAVVSNASSHRMDEDAPLLIPEINADHAEVLVRQRARRGGRGFIATNPNCSTVAVAMALAPIHRAFGVERVSVVTLQALSGAGLPGVPALLAQDNVIPFIGGEAAKIETEPRRILGRVVDGRFVDAGFTVSARVHRVPVSDGHLASLSIATTQPCTPSAAAEALASFRGEPQELGLPSAPRRPIHVLTGTGRPQPALDRDREDGMAVSVGSIEPCPVLGLKLEALVHNTVRGAAGAALLNAEWLLARGWLEGLS